MRSYEEAQHMPNESVVHEAGFGGQNGSYDVTGNFMNLPKKDRKAAKERALALRQKWDRSRAIRDEWTPDMFAEEERRIAEEIEEWERRRDAA